MVSMVDWGTVTEDIGTVIKKSTAAEPSRASIQKYLAVGTAAAYFILLGIPLSFLPLKTITVTEAIDLIKTIAAVLGGIVGMIWIFYFKTESQ